MKRNIIILTIILCLSLSGVVYANWNDNLQINSKLMTGAMDFDNINNFQISLIDKVKASVTKQEDKFLLEIDNINIEEFMGANQGFQISYVLLPSQINTINKVIESNIVDKVVMVGNSAGTAFNLIWDCEHTIKQEKENENIFITHTFTLSKESRVELSTYVASIEDKYKIDQMASMEKWNELQEKLDPEKLINEKEDSSLDVDNIDGDTFAQQFFQEFILGSKETNYNFTFNIVVTQAPVTSTSNLFTYGLWTDEVLFEGSIVITYPELVQNPEYLNVEEFEKLNLQKEVPETIEKPKTSKLGEKTEIIIDTPHDPSDDTEEETEEISELDLGDTTEEETEEPSELESGDTTSEEVGIPIT